MSKKNMNETFVAYLKDSSTLTERERALCEAYKQCVIANEKTEGDMALTFALTDKFEEILNMM